MSLELQVKPQLVFQSFKLSDDRSSNGIILYDVKSDSDIISVASSSVHTLQSNPLSQLHIQVAPLCDTPSTLDVFDITPTTLDTASSISKYILKTFHFLRMKFHIHRTISSRNGWYLLLQVELTDCSSYQGYQTQQAHSVFLCCNNVDTRSGGHINVSTFK